MKKIIALALSLLMLVGVCLTGCGKKDETGEGALNDIEGKASEKAETISMYLMSEKEVQKCQDCKDADAHVEGAKTCYAQNKQLCTYRTISNEINRITESKYKTRVVLYFYTEAEYYQKLEAAFAAREQAKLNGMFDEEEIEDEEETAPVDETETNELGQIVIKYPTIADYQVDVFYLGGQDKFEEYKSQDLLAGLDGQLSDASKKLNQYIFPQYLSSMKALSGATYAIPNNRTIGEYTYMLLNKDALNQLYRRTEGGNTTYEDYYSITGYNCKDFLDQVDKYLSDEFYPIYKQDGITEMDMLTNLQYFGTDKDGMASSDDFSLIGAYYLKNQTFKQDAVGLSNLFENAEFKASLETLVEYKERGYYEAEEGKKFAVGFVKGGAELVEQYGDEYEMVVIETPRLDEAGLYDHTFAVCANTSSMSRSMQIITLLNTNSEFRNLVQYGIEGVHYQVVDTGVEKNELGDTYQVARRLNSDYVMDINKTGNVFIAYPLEDANVLPSIYDYGVKQNQDATVKVNLGFNFTYNTEKKAYDIPFDSQYTLSQSTLKRVRELSDNFLAGYLACDTLEEYHSFISEMNKTLVEDTRTRRVLNSSADYDHGMNAAGDGEAACKKTCGYLSCVYNGYLYSVVGLR